ncbi:alcohol dehydrogenase catalytic domain-containing protein [Streptomyces sp. NPDC002764]|uniref:alcohol dehydrogenase catalytic domain-containing protein n=1 Tax=Streptomyces sp. NPDC002764 TaxID=3154428 RepID=UPI00333219D8
MVTGAVPRACRITSAVNAKQTHHGVQTGVKATASDAVAVGHEVSGVVRTLGPDLGRGLTVGTRVTLEAGKTCGRCAGRARRRPCTRMQFGARSGRIGLVMTGRVRERPRSCHGGFRHRCAGCAPWGAHWLCHAAGGKGGTTRAGPRSGSPTGVKQPSMTGRQAGRVRSHGIRNLWTGLRCWVRPWSPVSMLCPAPGEARRVPSAPHPRRGPVRLRLPPAHLVGGRGGAGLRRHPLRP